jgi:predicted nucleotidyltransferase
VTDFGELIRALSGCGVRFVLIGGVAATLHGSARLTQDVDVVYARDEENLSRIAQALAPLQPYLRGAPPGLPFKLDAKTLSAGLNFTLSTSAGDIDLLGEITGVGGYEALAGHTIEVELFGARCRCLDLPTLIAAKVAAGRPKDLESIAELRALLQERR